VGKVYLDGHLVVGQIPLAGVLAPVRMLRLGRAADGVLVDTCTPQFYGVLRQ
jgi:hypothetical protein